MHGTAETCPMKPKPKTKKKHGLQTQIRQTNGYRKLRSDIKARDRFLCRHCYFERNKLTTENLQVHHIIPIAEDPALALEEDNLITLCEGCHELAEAGIIPRKKQKELLKRKWNERWEDRQLYAALQKDITLKMN